MIEYIKNSKSDAGKNRIKAYDGGFSGKQVSAGDNLAEQSIIN